MRIFNSFQLVAIFIGWPFLTNWLSTATFAGAAAVFYAACALYVIWIGFAVAAVYEFIGKD